MKSFLRQHRGLYRIAIEVYMRLLVLGARLGFMKLPDAGFYKPLFRADLHDPGFLAVYSQIHTRTLLSREKLFLLYQLFNTALAVEGDAWECGVFQGGSALMFHTILRQKNLPAPRDLWLFDSFAGLPPPAANVDLHNQGDLDDVNLDELKKLFATPAPHFQVGWMPDTFRGLENRRIAFAHVDVDLYRSVLDCCEFIYPRMSTGGIFVFDDYGFPTCPGARKAVEEFFALCPEKPIVFSTGQAVVIKR